MLSRLVHQSSSTLRTDISFRLFSQSSPSIASTVRVEKQGDVAVVKIDLPNTKENVLNKALSSHMKATFEKVGSFV